LITPANLKSCTHKDLAQMAKRWGIAGWHAMRKEQLVQALLKSAKKRRAVKSETPIMPGKATDGNGMSAGRLTRRQTAAQRRIKKVQADRELLKDLSTAGKRKRRAASAADRIILMVRDPYWLQATWELSSKCIERAQAALAENWHAARPVLRLLEAPSSLVRSSAERVVRVIDIHGAVKSWFLDVQNPPSTFRVEIGYLTSDDQFQPLARSNVVTTPRPGGTDLIDESWHDVIANSERIFAMSGGYERGGRTGELREWLEERLQRPLGSPTSIQFGSGAEGALDRPSRLALAVDAEMIVYGMTTPDAFVTMAGEPLKVSDDGSFTARVSMPDRRQVIPIVASTADGVEEQTVVLAVERNTKVMEPRVSELE
jgi:hypothetical protein